MDDGMAKTPTAEVGQAVSMKAIDRRGIDEITRIRSTSSLDARSAQVGASHPILDLSTEERRRAIQFIGHLRASPIVNRDSSLSK
jgi:hypothetical protein